jgi:methionyl-tRNA formyltransferase
VAAAILAGDDVTGVSIMEVVRALDAGPVVARVEEPIAPSDSTGTLEKRLAAAGARLLAETLDPWLDRRVEAAPQDDSLATYAPQLTRADARLDWSQPAVELWRRVRAFNPWPVAFTTWRGEELRIWEAWPLPGGHGAPGEVLAAERLPADAGGEETFSVHTGSGRLAIKTVQRQGRKALAGLEFLRGQRDLVGSRFE